jgi:hypothetical protein
MKKVNLNNDKEVENAIASSLYALGQYGREGKVSADNYQELYEELKYNYEKQVKQRDQSYGKGDWDWSDEEAWESHAIEQDTDYNSEITNLLRIINERLSKLKSKSSKGVKKLPQRMMEDYIDRKKKSSKAKPKRKVCRCKK